jgi:hypothetical protein
MPVFPNFDRFFSLTEYLNGFLSARENSFRIIGNDDETRKLAFDLDSAVSTGTTRTWKVPDADLDLRTMAGTRKNVLASSGNTTMTDAMSGSVMLLDGAGVDYVLPAITAANIGMAFRFFTSVTATDQTVTAGSGDLLIGSVEIIDEATPDTDAFSPDVSDDLIITLNGSTTGGLIGSYLDLVAISTTRWAVTGRLRGSGAQSTPFS